MLGTPPAFILSQDQTLKKSLFPNQFKSGYVRLKLGMNFYFRKNSICHTKALWQMMMTYTSYNVILLILKGFVSETSLSISKCISPFRILFRNCFGVGYTIHLSRNIFDCFQSSIKIIFVDNYLVASAPYRRKRDLNPRAAINDLLPFQGSPFSLLGISPKLNLSLFIK